MRRLSLTIAFAALAMAGADRAAAATAPMPDPAAALNAAVMKTAAPNAAVMTPDRQSHALPQPGVAKTSLEGRFSERASGAIGFLCGRPDSLDERAASQPYGSDPQGKFLGARLAFAFR